MSLRHGRDANVIKSLISNSSRTTTLNKPARTLMLQKVKGHTNKQRVCDGPKSRGRNFRCLIL